MLKFNDTETRTLFNSVEKHKLKIIDHAATHHTQTTYSEGHIDAITVDTQYTILIMPKRHYKEFKRLRKELNLRSVDAFMHTKNSHALDNNRNGSSTSYLPPQKLLTTFSPDEKIARYEECKQIKYKIVVKINCFTSGLLIA